LSQNPSFIDQQTSEKEILSKHDANLFLVMNDYLKKAQNINSR